MEANLTSVDAVMNQKFGEVGSTERENFRHEAYSYCVGQVIHEARRKEKVTQEELAKRIGTSKSYISRIEKGIIEPGVGTFYRIIDALGLRIDIVKPII